MLQIRPGEYLPIERQLEDPTDSTTRYVRAYVRKKKGTGEELLATLDLKDQGGQRFTYYYQVPQDSDPYYLSVVIKIFDDSGYTTESTRYERSYQTYLVAERWGLMYGHGGGGTDVNYDKVRNIVKEEVGKVPKPVQKEVDFRQVLSALNEINKNIRNIKIPRMPEIPQPEKVDFGPMIKSIEKVQNEIRAIRIPETDLSPILKGMKTAIDDFLKSITTMIRTNREELTNEFEKLKKEIKSVTFVTLRTEEKSPESVKKRRIFV